MGSFLTSKPILRSEFLELECITRMAIDSKPMEIRYLDPIAHWKAT